MINLQISQAKITSLSVTQVGESDPISFISETHENGFITFIERIAQGEYTINTSGNLDLNSIHLFLENGINHPNSKVIWDKNAVQWDGVSLKIKTYTFEGGNYYPSDNVLQNCSILILKYN